MFEPRLQVFVSSVMADDYLAEERQTVVDAIRGLQLTTPWAFEFTNAEPQPSDEVYLREVERSDILVLVVDDRHSEAVQRELERAEGRRLPILAFVRHLGDRPESTERAQVLTWLGPRVKYRLFRSLDELGEVVTSSTASEIIRGYRAFRDRLASADVLTLLNRVTSPPTLVVHTAEPRELPEVKATLAELVPWYPNIEPWIEKVLGDIDPSMDEIRVARVGGEIAAVAVSRDKEPGVRKFSTVYVRASHRGEAVGPHLIHAEVTRAAADGVRKAYVTFADELRASLAPIFSRYGFTAEGVSAARYRASAGEWVYGKRFLYENVDAARFGGVIERSLLEERGGVTRRRLSPTLWLVERPSLALPRGTDREYFILSTSGRPEDEYAECQRRLRGRRWIFVSLYGRPADVSHWSHRCLNWIDGYDLEALLYPVRLQRPLEESLICTIRTQYADALIPKRDQPSLFAPERLQIRPDNVYYRSPTSYQDLRRGSRIFFYVSKPEGSVRGHARIRETRIGSPEECIAAYGDMGIFRYGDLSAIAGKHRGRVLAVAFDWYEEGQRALPLEGLKELVVGYNPITAKRVSFDLRGKILEAMQ